MHKMIVLCFVILMIMTCVSAINFSITDMQIIGNYPKVNHQQMISVIIHNDSNTSAVTTLTIFDENENVFTFAYSISQAADFNALLPWTPLHDGNRLMKASIDANDDNPADNNFSTRIMIHRGQDPAVTGIFVPSIMAGNVSNIVQVFLTNFGDDYTSFFNLQVKIDNNKIYDAMINPIGEGELKRFDINFISPASGSHTITAIIDINSSLDEFSKSNNSGSANFSIGNFEDQNCNRECITEIIRNMLATKQEDLEGLLSLCRTEKNILDQNYQVIAAKYNDSVSSFNTCNNSLKYALEENGKTPAKLQEAAVICDNKISQQKQTDENMATALVETERQKTNAADTEKQSIQKQLDSKNMMNIIAFGVIAAGAIIFLTYTILQKQRAGML